MSSVSIFISKVFRNLREIENFEETLKSFGVLSKMSGYGECGWTKVYNLDVNNSDAPIILKLLKDENCFCHYQQKKK